MWFSVSRVGRQFGNGWVIVTSHMPCDLSTSLRFLAPGYYHIQEQELPILYVFMLRIASSPVEVGVSIPADPRDLNISLLFFLFSSFFSMFLLHPRLVFGLWHSASVLVKYLHLI